MSDHEHVYELRTRWHPSPGGGYYQTTEGYYCKCGKPRPWPTPVDQVKAAIAYIRRRY